MIKGAIFDIDGTLLDSMPIWENVGARYLATLGIKAKPDLKERLDALSLPEGAIYMQKEYGLSVSAEDILEGVNQVVKDFYYKEAVMKPGAYALVKRLKENGVKLIIATATDKEMAKAALIRNGIWQDFMGMLTCEEAGAGKTSPKVFELARQKLGTKKEETWVFEDSLYAVKTATEAGFPVCSIYDTYSVGNAKEIQRLSNIYVRDFSEIGDYSFSNMKTVLTIAGSDSSGGAGIQADIKTLTVHKVYAMTCITALTAQNTVGITGIMPVPAEFFKKQMESIFTDIKPDAVKIGMIASKEQAEIIAEYLEKYSTGINKKITYLKLTMPKEKGTELDKVSLSNKADINLYRYFFVLLIGAMVYCTFFEKEFIRKTEWYFAVFALSFGLLIIAAAQPACNSWDEQIHFRDAYKIASGRNVAWTEAELDIVNRVNIKCNTKEENELLRNYMDKRNAEIVMKEKKETVLISYDKLAYIPMAVFLFI